MSITTEKNCPCPFEETQYTYILFIADLILGLHGLFDVSKYEMLVMLGTVALGMNGALSYTFALK